MKKIVWLLIGILFIALAIVIGCNFNLSGTGTIVIKNRSDHVIEAVVYAAGPDYSRMNSVNLTEPFQPGSEISLTLVEGKYQVRVYILPLTGDTIDMPAGVITVAVEMKKTSTLTYYRINHLELN